MVSERIEPEFLTTNAELAGRTAGGLLKAERQCRGLTEKSIADQLHITVHYVKAIESDNYEKLPGKVFAKGYIKSYATLLQLDENDIIGLYDQFAAMRVEVAQEEVRLVAARKQKDRMLPWLVFAIVAFLAGFLVFWVYNQFFSGSDNLNPAPEAQINPAVIPDSGVVTVVSGALIVDRESRQESPAQTMNNTLIARQDKSDSVANVDSIDDSSPGPGSIAADVDVGPGSDGRLIEVINIGPDQLLISFTGVCWIELKDAGTDKVYREIQRAGDQLRITGTAPFSIHLGDAPFVTMQLNGKEVDVEESIRIDNSARLIVGL